MDGWKDTASFQKDNPSGAVDLSDISDIELAEAGGGVGTAVLRLSDAAGVRIHGSIQEL